MRHYNARAGSKAGRIVEWLRANPGQHRRRAVALAGDMADQAHQLDQILVAAIKHGAVLHGRDEGGAWWAAGPELDAQPEPPRAERAVRGLYEQRATDYLLTLEPGVRIASPDLAAAIGCPRAQVANVLREAVKAGRIRCHRLSPRKALWSLRLPGEPDELDPEALPRHIKVPAGVARAVANGPVSVFDLARHQPYTVRVGEPVRARRGRYHDEETSTP